MARLAALRLLLRRERAEFGAIVLVTLLVAFTAFISAAGMRLFERAADDGLRASVAAAPVAQRTIQLTSTRLVLPPDTAAQTVDLQAEGRELGAGFPDAVRELIGTENLAVSSVRMRVTNPPEYPVYVTLRYQDRVDDVVDLVGGRWPAATGDQLPAVAEFREQTGGLPGWPSATNHYSDPLRHFEVALRDTTAQHLGLSVGSTMRIDVDLVDPMFASSILRPADVVLAPTELLVTGLYSVPDPDSDAWFGDPRLISDDVGEASDEPTAYINAYVPPDAVPGLLSSGLPFEYRWRYPIELSRLDADTVAHTAQGFRIMESRTVGSTEGPDITAEAGLLSLLERHTGLRSASESVLALAATAPLALAVGAIAMAAVMHARRRRAAVILARGRGASRRLLFATALVEAVLVAIIGCSIGLALAIMLEPSAKLTPSLLAVSVIGLIAIVVLIAAAWPQLRQSLGDLERSGRPAQRTDVRRLVLELTVIALAVVGAYVFRQRGVAATSGGVPADAAGLDPFLAAVPPLIALAAGMAAVRLYRPVMAVTGWLADRRHDLVPVLGVRTIARGASSSLPVLVLILGGAFAAFTSVISTSVDRAQQASSWSAAGADIRLEPVGTRRELPATLDPWTIPGVEAAAEGFVEPRARAPAGTRLGTVMLLAIEPAAYAEVVRDSPVAPAWPAGFFAEPDDGPVPAIIGTQLTGGDLRLGAGDTFDFTVLARGMQVQALEVRSGVAGLTRNEAFIVMPRAWLEQRLGREVRPSVSWLRVPQTAVPGVIEQSGAAAGDVHLTSRYEAFADLHDEPLLNAVAAGFVLAFSVSVAFAVLTIVGAVILSAGRRTRDAAILRTLGLKGRQATRLTMVEHAPPILLALPVGLALGIGIALAVSPALGLGALAGSSGSIPLAIDWIALAILATLLAVLGFAAVVGGSWLSRRATILNALRISSD